MDTTTHRLRAAILATMMILAVVAGSVAFVGTAAATAPDSSSIDTSSINEGEIKTITIAIGNSTPEDVSNITVKLPPNLALANGDVATDVRVTNATNPGGATIPGVGSGEELIDN